MPERHADNDVVFHSSALQPGELFVRELRGREALSRLYEFELLLETTFQGAIEDDQVADMFAGSAYVAFGAAEEHKIHGVLRAIELVSMADASPVFYRVTLVPRLWYATRTFRSRVFQDLSVPEIVAQVLADTGMAEDEHYVLRLTGSYKKRDYVVQYQETDYALICRLMEHEGIFFFFEHGEACERLVVADANEAFAELPGHETIAYDPRAGTTDPREAVVALGRRQQVTPTRVHLREYNHRTPSLSLVADAPVDEAGRGTQVYYGEHFRDPAEGRRLARVRAQEHLAQREVCAGRARVRGLRSGHKFTLENHFLPQFDQQYVVTEVTHAAAQGGAGDGPAQGYASEFVAIPYAVAFRPARVTPRPRIVGLMHARVDGAGSGTAAPINDKGEYKVVLPFDTVGQAGGRASRWVRMAQPSSGPDYGMHFPLHVGTEVVVAHIDGDPDRPIIVASVPNAETMTPVHAGNATQSAIRTRSGIHIEFEDDA